MLSKGESVKPCSIAFSFQLKFTIFIGIKRGIRQYFIVYIVYHLALYSD